MEQNSTIKRCKREFQAIHLLTCSLPSNGFLYHDFMLCICKHLVFCHVLNVVFVNYATKVKGFCQNW